VAKLTRVVLILSFVSLFTDMASEMLYPVMPIYLRSIGFSVALIGILEGLAEATAGLSKGYFGKLSDMRGERASFVRWGYSISALSKPMMAILTYPWWVFIARTFDRLGKGIRTGARDAMLSDEATRETKGAVFGFHRSMDTAGAVIGPSLALLFLYFFPGQYRTMFLLAFFPGLMAILLTFIVKDRLRRAPKEGKVAFFTSFSYWTQAPAIYRRLVAGLLLFTLFNSSDLFLLLKMKSATGSDTTVIEVYIFYNIVYALLSYPIGIMADKLGLKRMFIIGLFLFAAAYAGIAFGKDMYTFLLIFLLYGAYAAATEGISKAWISNISSNENTASAIGTYTGLQSIFTLLASSIAGVIWMQFGPAATFLLSAGFAVVVAIYLAVFVKEKPAAAA
jgi:MFS family permease